MCNPETFFLFFFVSHTNKASRTGIKTDTRQIFNATKQFFLALNERAMDFYIDIRQKKRNLLLQNHRYVKIFYKITIESYSAKQLRKTFNSK